MGRLRRTALALTPLLLLGITLAQDASGVLWRDDILPSILAALVTVATAAIGWAATRASAWFDARAKESESTLVGNALSMAYTLAGVTVQHLAQTVVEKLRAASKDGKLDPRDAADILKAAVYEVWTGLPKSIRDTLMAQYGSFDKITDAVLKPAIEAQVHEAKVLTPSTTVPIQNEAEALRELQHARERLRSLTSA